MFTLDSHFYPVVPCISNPVRSHQYGPHSGIAPTSRVLLHFSNFKIGYCVALPQLFRIPVCAICQEKANSNFLGVLYALRQRYRNCGFYIGSQVTQTPSKARVGVSLET
jgi:hypothetical protein